MTPDPAHLAPIRRRPPSRLARRFTLLERVLGVMGCFFLVGVTLGTFLVEPRPPEHDPGWSIGSLICPGVFFLLAAMSYVLRMILRRWRGSARGARGDQNV